MNTKDKRLRIAILSFDWKNLSRNSPETFVQKLNRDGFEPEANIFFMVTCGHENFVGTKNNFSFVQKKYPFFPPICHLWASLYFPKTLLREKFRPDVILVSDVGFIPAARIASLIFKCPVVLRLNNMPTDLAKTRSMVFFRESYYRIMEIIFMHFADRIYTINQTIKNYAINRGFPEERIILFAPNTILRDQEIIERSRPDFVKNKLGISIHTKIILSVGRLEKEKGFDRILKTLSQCKDIDCAVLFIGEGSLQKELEVLVQELGMQERVYFLGGIPREEIWSYYKAASAFILLSRSEGLGLVFWEAMYVKVPVIGSPVGGILETIGAQQERGFFWSEEYGIEDFRKKILKIFTRDEEVSEIVDRAQSYVFEKISKTNTTFEDLTRLVKKE